MKTVPVNERLFEEAHRLLDNEYMKDNIAMVDYWSLEISLKASPDTVVQALINRVRQMRKNLDEAI